MLSHDPSPLRTTAAHQEPLPLAVSAMALLILVMIGRIQEFVPGLVGLQLAKLLFVALAILVLASKDIRQEQPFSHPQIKAFLLLFVLGCISVVTSRWPGESWRFMSNDFLIQSIFLFFLIKVGVSWRAFRFICWALIVTAVLVSLATLTEHETGRASLSGSAYDANDLAFALVVLLPFFYFMAKACERKALRLLLFAGMGVTIVTIVVTQSRGGFIGLMVVTGAILLHEKIRPMSVLIVGGVLFVLLTTYAPEGYWDRMSSIGSREQDYNMTAESGRVEVWKRGLGFMLANPLLGVGPSAFSVADGESRGGAGKWSTAHNSFILIGAEFGITGLILFLVMITASLKALRAARDNLPSDAREVTLLYAVEVGFYGYAAAGFFLSQAYATVLYLLVGLATIATNLTRNSPQTRKISPVKESRTEAR